MVARKSNHDEVNRPTHPGAQQNDRLASDGNREDRTVGEREKRLARNEARFRDVNERVAEVAESFAEGERTADPVHFSCECGSETCTEQIAMTLVEYEAVRSMPTRFAVVAGHEVPEIERVVERTANYFVVEKDDDDAERVALETDPASWAATTFSRHTTSGRLFTNRPLARSSCRFPTRLPGACPSRAPVSHRCG